MFNKRKAFGQHFLRDTSIIQKIVDAFFDELEKAHPKGPYRIVEIGPGRGALTEHLITFINTNPEAHLLIIEKDRGIALEWGARLKVHKRAEVVCSDFLDLESSAWQHPEYSTFVISNLPYSTGTAITNLLCEFPKKITSMVLMFQAEVAQRICASPGSKSTGSLSLWLGNRWESKKLFNVPPGAFSPPPKVQSEVIVMKPRPLALITDHPEKLPIWENLLKKSFAQRRKMLRSAFNDSLLERAGIDGTLRAEKLDWQQWLKLFEAYSGSV